jgi:prepilin-type N-terminal cleavage/methylation domain-containing protein
MTRTDEQGFSLVELLVALSISSLIAGLLFGGYSFVSKAWSNAQTSEDNSSEIYAAQTFLRRAFNDIPEMQRNTQFVGSTTGVQFTANFAMPGEAVAPTLVSLVAETCPEGRCLVVALAHSDAQTGKAQEFARTPLVRGIDDIAFTYLAGGSEPSWHSAWSTQDGVPMLVRIDVQLPKGKRVWPTLYLVPATAG